MKFTKRKRDPEFNHVSISMAPINKIRPSPENETLYAPVSSSDPEVVALARSIIKHGLREPIVITLDGCIISGHRRYMACRLAGNDPPLIQRALNARAWALSLDGGDGNE